MGINITGMPNEVSVTGSLPPVAPDSSTEVKTLVLVRSTPGDDTETVPVDKKWFIVGFLFNVDSEDSADCNLYVNTTQIFRITSLGSSTYKPYQVTPFTFPYPACPVATAGQDVKITTSTYSTRQAVYVYYIEVDA